MIESNKVHGFNFGKRWTPDHSYVERLYTAATLDDEYILDELFIQETISADTTPLTRLRFLFTKFTKLLEIYLPFLTPHVSFRLREIGTYFTISVVISYNQEFHQFTRIVGSTGSVEDVEGLIENMKQSKGAAGQTAIVGELQPQYQAIHKSLASMCEGALKHSAVHAMCCDEKTMFLATSPTIRLSIDGNAVEMDFGHHDFEIFDGGLDVLLELLWDCGIGAAVKLLEKHERVPKPRELLDLLHNTIGKLGRSADKLRLPYQEFQKIAALLGR